MRVVMSRAFISPSGIYELIAAINLWQELANSIRIGKQEFQRVAHLELRACNIWRVLREYSTDSDKKYLLGKLADRKWVDVENQTY